MFIKCKFITLIPYFLTSKYFSRFSITQVSYLHFILDKTTLGDIPRNNK